MSVKGRGPLCESRGCRQARSHAPAILMRYGLARHERMFLPEQPAIRVSLRDQRTENLNGTETTSGPSFASFGIGGNGAARVIDSMAALSRI